MADRTPSAAYTAAEALRMIAESPCSVNMMGGCVGATQQVRVRGTGPHTDPPTERQYRTIVGCPKHFALQVLGGDDAASPHDDAHDKLIRLLRVYASHLREWEAAQPRTCSTLHRRLHRG